MWEHEHHGPPHHGPPHFRPPPRPHFEWIPATMESVSELAHMAVVAGEEPGQTGSPLLVIRAHHNGDLIPGKLAIDDKAYIPYGKKEVVVDEFEVLCSPAETIHWVSTKKGNVPEDAIPGGNTQDGDTLYIGRVAHKNSLTPGKIQPNHGCLYISFGGSEVSYKKYEVLCKVD